MMSSAASDSLVDLILPTIGRTTELERFLESLRRQSYRRFRLIVVDQNIDDRLASILDSFDEAFPILRRTSAPGASRARNTGLREVQGEIVGFPDDDCWYPPELLRSIVEAMARNPVLDGVGGRTIDESGHSSFVFWASTDEPGEITHANVWQTAVAVTIFVRRQVVEAVGEFDESLGVGARTRWGSGEETDYVLRTIAAGFRLGYDPGIRVYHESPNPPFSKSAAARGYAYGMGHSRVLRKHGYRRRFALYRVAQLTAGSLFFLVTGRFGRARFYWSMALGRAVGWLTGAN